VGPGKKSKLKQGTKNKSRDLEKRRFLRGTWKKVIWDLGKSHTPPDDITPAGADHQLQEQNKSNNKNKKAEQQEQEEEEDQVRR